MRLEWSESAVTQSEQRALRTYSSSERPLISRLRLDCPLTQSPDASLVVSDYSHLPGYAALDSRSREPKSEPQSGSESAACKEVTAASPMLNGQKVRNCGAGAEKRFESDDLTRWRCVRLQFAMMYQHYCQRHPSNSKHPDSPVGRGFPTDPRWLIRESEAQTEEVVTWRLLNRPYGIILETGASVKEMGAEIRARMTARSEIIVRDLTLAVNATPAAVARGSGIKIAHSVNLTQARSLPDADSPSARPFVHPPTSHFPRVDSLAQAAPPDAQIKDDSPDLCLHLVIPLCHFSYCRYSPGGDDCVKQSTVAVSPVLSRLERRKSGD